MIDTHPKSSASINPYFKNLWRFVKDFEYKLIGKPYGCKPILESLGITEYYKPGIEHENIDEIDYADFTLGNSLGIAEGISFGYYKIHNKYPKIFVFISDAQLNMGVVLEAILSIPTKINNILLVVDYNKSGSRGDLLIPINFDIFKNWNITHIYDNKIGNFKENTNNVWIYHSYLNFL